MMKSASSEQQATVSSDVVTFVEGTLQVAGSQLWRALDCLWKGNLFS
jgi:hypothetical protein